MRRHDTLDGSTRVAALDGFRGLAVLLVAWGHLRYEFIAVQAGGVGVSMFFVLSGYLITAILMRDLDGFGRIQMKRFFVRRARRLLPALFLLVAIIGLAAGVKGWLDVWWDRAWPTLLYISDIEMSKHGGLMFFSQTWTLSVEEHFYMVWPLVLPFVWRNPQRLIALTAALLAYRVWLVADGRTSHAYFTTDGNAYALLAGCWVAVQRPRGRSWWAPVSVLGIVALAVFGDAMSQPAWLPVIASVLSVPALIALREGRHRWLEFRTLVWFGTISYGLYLWHGALLWITDADRIVVLGISIAIAWLSWTFLEKRWLNPKSLRSAPAMRVSVPINSRRNAPTV